MSAIFFTNDTTSGEMELFSECLDNAMENWGLCNSYNFTLKEKHIQTP